MTEKIREGYMFKVKHLNTGISFLSEHNMASEGNDDESSEEDVEYDDMLEPPLIDQLKKILDEYPDDGQILKVN